MLRNKISYKYKNSCLVSPNLNICLVVAYRKYFFLKNVSCDNQKLWENFLKTFETTLSSYSSSTMMWNEVCFLETLCCRSPLLFSLTQNLFNEISSSEVCSFQTTWQKCKISAFEECVMHFITCCMSSFYPITFLALGKVLAKSLIWRK